MFLPLRQPTRAAVRGGSVRRKGCRRGRGGLGEPPRGPVEPVPTVVRAPRLRVYADRLVERVRGAKRDATEHKLNG